MRSYDSAARGRRPRTVDDAAHVSGLRYHNRAAPRSELTRDPRRCA